MQDFYWYNRNITSQLGREPYGAAQGHPDDEGMLCNPALVKGSPTGVKARQLTFRAWTEAYTVEVSVNGDVHHWGENVEVSRMVQDPAIPALIPREHFDFQDVASVACSDSISVALTCKGELFHWLFDNEPQKVLHTGLVPFKQITGHCGFIFALTTKGEMYYLKVADPPSSSSSSSSSTSSSLKVVEGNRLHLARIFEDYEIEFISSCNGKKMCVGVWRHARAPDMSFTRKYQWILH